MVTGYINGYGSLSVTSTYHEFALQVSHLRDRQHYAMRLLEFLNYWRALPSCYATLSVRKASISSA